MLKHLGLLNIGLLGCLVAASGQIACSHDKSKASTSEIAASHEDIDRGRSVDVRAQKDANAKASHEDGHDKQRGHSRAKNAEKRTAVAAERNAAAVASGTVGEGSEEEYAADVDAAMGTESGTATSEASASTLGPVSQAAGTEVDNSRVNRLSDGDRGLTAQQQGSSKTDVDITRKIRRSITSNKELSTYAHNIKIITREGRVVLKGPVRSEAERKIVEDIAVTVAGSDHVTSGLDIKSR